MVIYFNISKVKKGFPKGAPFGRRVVFPLLIDWEVHNMLAEESPMMAKANATIDIMEMSPKEKWLYENRMKYEHDRASCISEGYRQGIDKGVYQAKLETAKNLLEMGFSTDSIIKATGLNLNEIEKL